jgi:hypothetical protein
MTDYWKDAPERADWIGWGKDGEAHYYVEYFDASVGAFSVSTACPQHNDTNKAGQFEKRPEEEL